ncbi:MAG: helix-turn-helix domain-containing protein [Actinomycetota bacterium]|nr:helix-turn-helix domain-containing protein [Actinomycetota bacterium]
MRCQAAEVVRRARERRGLTQRRLAVRAGTSQDAISRIERGVEDPSWERLRELLWVLGNEASIEATPLFAGLSAGELASARDLTPAERLREACSWNLVATELEIAGERARRAGHPATRLTPP